MNIKLSTLAIFSALLVSAPVFAQSPTTAGLQTGSVKLAGNKGECAKGGACQSHKGMGHGRMGRIGFRHHRSPLAMLHGEYALSSDQLEKIFNLKSQFLTQAAPKFEDLKLTSRKERDLMTQPNVNRSEILSLQGQLNKDKNEIANLKVENRLDQLSVLTDAQRKELRLEILKRSARG